MAAALALNEVLAKLGSKIERGGALEMLGGLAPPALALGWPELDALLPDGGLPRGVVELAAPRALGGATSIALAAMRAAHARDARAWCAWLDPDASLYGPGVAKAGVDLARLLVVRPPRSELGRIAVKLAAARAFDVVAVDMDALPLASSPSAPTSSATTSQAPRAKRRRAWPEDVLVRKLALAAEESGATILLLTNALLRRAVPWPVAMRLELERPHAGTLAVRVAKDRRGRVGLAKTVPFQSRPVRDASGV